jgi:hypothetical protein
MVIRSFQAPQVRCLNKQKTAPSPPEQPGSTLHANLPGRSRRPGNADVRLAGGHDLGSVWFETHAA